MDILFNVYNERTVIEFLYISTIIFHNVFDNVFLKHMFSVKTKLNKNLEMNLYKMIQLRVCQCMRGTA